MIYRFELKRQLGGTLLWAFALAGAKVCGKPVALLYH